MLPSVYSIRKQNRKSLIFRRRNLSNIIGRNLWCKFVSLVEQPSEVNRALEAKEKCKVRGGFFSWECSVVIILWSGPEQFQRVLPSPFPTRGGELSRLSVSCPENQLFKTETSYVRLFYLKFVHSWAILACLVHWLVRLDLLIVVKKLLADWSLCMQILVGCTHLAVLLEFPLDLENKIFIIQFFIVGWFHFSFFVICFISFDIGHTLGSHWCVIKGLIWTHWDVLSDEQLICSDAVWCNNHRCVMVMVGEKSEIIDFSGQFSATGEQHGHVVVHDGHGYQNFLLPACTGAAPHIWG